MDGIATATFRKSRSYDYELARLDVAAAMRMSGAEYLNALVARELGAPPSFMSTMNVFPLEVLEPGRITVEAEPGDWFLNPMGSVHGGYVASLLDTALGCAVHSILPAGVGYATAELKVNMTRGVRPGLRLRADGGVIHFGKQMATSEAQVRGVEDGKLYAHGSTTCFLFPLDAKAG